MRLATFNIENLDDEPLDAGSRDASFEQRAPLLRAQLARLKADVLCLQEVHGQKTDSENEGDDRSLRALDRLLEGTPYAAYEKVTTATTKGDPFAERNLVTLVRPGLTIAASDQIKHKYALAPEYNFQTDNPDGGAKKITWQRPMLYTALTLETGETLHVINVHLKSKIPSNVAGQKLDNYTWKTAGSWAEGFFVSSMKRVGAAIEARMFIDTLIDADPEAQIVICGDFNAEPGEVPIQALRGEIGDTNNPALSAYVMFPCSHTIAEDQRFTLYHHGKKNLLDHMLMSRSLVARYQTAEIHNELVRDESVGYAFENKYPASDHAPFLAVFDLTGAAVS